MRVSPGDLLLDPNNPRLISSSFEEGRYTPARIASSEVQNQIYNKISKSEYHIQKLIRSIGESGFLPGLGDMIVQSVNRTEKYLVIEGNRRLTAIRFLLLDGARLDPKILNSIKKLDVKLFAYDPSSSLSEEEVKDRLLGMIHIQGPEAWGAMEKAHFISKSYEREYRRRFPRSEPTYKAAVAREVAKLYSDSLGKIWRHLAVYRVFEQLKAGHYEVRADHYSLLDMVLSKRDLRRSYFGFDEGVLQFSKQGLSRFNRLCAESKCPVHDPQRFRHFHFVFVHGTEQDLRDIETKRFLVQDVREKVEARACKKQFTDSLQSVAGLLKDLDIKDYQGYAKEDLLIQRICRLVEKKLKRIFKG
ncbi:MAG: hypothetical protein JXQ75_24340 [Phycisphaerae bacterium]|nr:hypothetical protein [Phycisphaerae bacterium]